MPSLPAHADPSTGSDELDPVSVYTREHQLEYLQLRTRQAIAARLTSGGRQPDGDDRMPALEPRAQHPDKWQLVPEDVRLHSWQRECLAIWMEHRRGTVKVATGGGKTLFALAIAQELQNSVEPDLRLVIVVPTVPLMFQWQSELLRSNLPTDAIGLMGGGQEMAPPRELRVLVCVINSARDRLPALVDQVGWASRMLLVVDECHRAAAAQARRIFETRPRYTLGLSATPEHDLDEDVPSVVAYESSVVGKALGPIIYDFTLQQSLNAGLLTPFEVWHVGLPLSPSEGTEHARMSREISELRKSLQVRHRNSRSKQSFLAWCQSQASRGGQAGGDAERFIGLSNARKRLLYHARARSDVTIGALDDACADPSTQAIVFHESIADIESLYMRALEGGIPAVLEHSKLPESIRAENVEAFREGIARVIISAKSLIEGFNVPSADLGIVAASSGSVRQRIQSLGRLLRRKSGHRSARVYILYVRDTEDESIYEKADWERVIGVDRNRYFHWDAAEGGPWAQGLTEVHQPPRAFRPPSAEVSVTDLQPGDRYPGRADGVGVKVDQQDSLRADDGTLLVAPTELIARIVDASPYRRAHITNAGHLIARSDVPGDREPEWRYLGELQFATRPAERDVIRLVLQRSGGRLHIARRTGTQGELRFALGPDNGGTEAGGHARDALIAWLQAVGSERGVAVRDFYWDGGTDYWVEVGGDRLAHAPGLPPLEFRE